MGACCLVEIASLPQGEERGQLLAWTLLKLAHVRFVFCPGNAHDCACVNASGCVYVRDLLHVLCVCVVHACMCSACTCDSVCRVCTGVVYVCVYVCVYVVPCIYLLHTHVRYMATSKCACVFCHSVTCLRHPLVGRL